MASPALRRGLRFVLAVALAVAPLQRLSTFVAPATVSAPTARRVALIAVGLGVESFAAPAWGSGACDASDVEKYQMLTYVKMMVSIRFFWGGGSRTSLWNERGVKACQGLLISSGS